MLATFLDKLGDLAGIPRSWHDHRMLVAALWILVFASAAALDGLHVRWNQAVADGRRLRAAVLSIAMWGVSLVGFAGVLEVSWWLLVPEGLGFFVGTYFAIEQREPIPEARVISIVGERERARADGRLAA